MAFSYGAGVTDVINCGPGVAGGGTFSFFARLALAHVNGTTRIVGTRRSASLLNFQLYFDAGTNQVNFVFTDGGAVHANAFWATGFLAGAIHTLVVNYDGAHLSLYADTDASPKAQAALVTTPDTGGTQSFYLGNEPGGTNSLDGTLYEAGWWPGTVLTGAEAAAMGAGTPPSTNPTDYWPLVSDAVALFGGHNGTVTGATVVAHSGANLYSAPPPAGPRFAIGSGFGGRRAVIGD